MTPSSSIDRRALVGAIGATLVASRPAEAAEVRPFNIAERRAAGAALGLGEQALTLDDAVLTDRLIAYARMETGQRLAPERVDRRWALAPSARDLPAELAAARSQDRLAGWLESLPPRAPGYRSLVEARGRYAALAAAGGWPTLSDGPTLRLGDNGPRVAALRARLASEGFGAPPATPDLFDAGLAETLRTFQALHGAEADGVLGPATRAALNVTAAERLGQIDASLERWRWMRDAPRDRIVVDTGRQEATLFRDGRPVLKMRAIVGSPRNPTPMFRAPINAVVFSPPWNVPSSIAANELLPAAARRPGLLESMGIRWVDGHLQQRPGPNNSLGLVKFDVDSPWGVYLHDTPGKGLFAQPVRAFSHGCMRLERPRELAAALLGWSSGAVDAAIATGATRRLALRRPIALLVTHRTARVEADGRVAFRPDIYGWDRKLVAALPPSPMAGNKVRPFDLAQGARVVIGL